MTVCYKDVGRTFLRYQCNYAGTEKNFIHFYTYRDSRSRKTMELEESEKQ